MKIEIATLMLLAVADLVLSNPRLMAQWAKTRERVERKKCGTPQVVVYPVNNFPEMVEVQPKLQKIFFERLHPKWVVLHRCLPTSGCCQVVGNKCGMKTSEDVKMTYYNLKNGKYYDLVVSNHTECECRKTYDTPK